MSMQSETVGALAAALSKAQGEMTAAVRDSANPFFKSTYADLASVLDAVRGPLSKHGLAVVQTTAYEPELGDRVCVDTTLLHASGEWVRGRLVMTPVKSDPQSIGSCITYARRYALQSIAGIAPDDDDDGNAASGRAEKPQAKPEPVKPAAKATPKPEPTGAVDRDALIKSISDAAKELGVPLAVVKHNVAFFNYKSAKEMPDDALSAFAQLWQKLLDRHRSGALADVNVVDALQGLPDAGYDPITALLKQGGDE